MKNAELMLRENMQQMSSTEKDAADFILANAEAVSEMNIQQLAEATFTSPSTIYRMCRSMGFSGYKEFRKALIYDLAMRRDNIREHGGEILRSDSVDSIIEKVTYKNIIAVEDTKNLIDPTVVSECVKLIDSARNVLIFGIGASFCAAKDAYLKFLRINKPCTINEDWHSQLLMAMNAGPGDLGIVISYSGETNEMVECMNVMKKNGTPIIAITRFDMSPVSRLADYKLYTAASESLFRSGAMSSRISQLNIIDILYTCYANSRYDSNLYQFTRTHINKNK